MHFPNTSRGMRFVLFAEILDCVMLIALSVASSLTSHNTALAEAVRNNWNTAFNIIELVLLLGCAILTIRGLQLAKDDEDSFNTAYEVGIAIFVVQIVFIVLTLCKVFRPVNGVKASSFSTPVLSMVTSCMIVNGIRRLFATQGDARNANFARIIMMLMIVCACLFFFPVLLVLIANASQVLGAILATVTLAFVLVTFILYLVLLGRSIKKFA